MQEKKKIQCLMDWFNQNNNVPIDQNFTGNYVRFNRRNPHDAIQEINSRMSQPSTLPPAKSNDIILGF